jgi:hypothetical protein
MTAAVLPAIHADCWNALLHGLLFEQLIACRAAGHSGLCGRIIPAQSMWVKVLGWRERRQYHERRVNFISSLATKSRKDLSPGFSFNASMSSTHFSFDKHRRITSAILATASSLTILNLHDRLGS